MAGPEEEMFFFIADISGYTSFMLKNQTDFTHGTLVVMQLMETLIKEARFPLEVSKLEGDAIFFYLRKEKIPKKYLEQPTLLGEKLLEFFSAFYDKLYDMIASTTCKCGGCSNVDELKLKMVAHYGKASITQIGSFKELSGVDVIIPHRLLKNMIKSKCYLLLTEGAYKKNLLPSGESVERSEEQDKDLGVIPVYVYYPKATIEKREGSSFAKKIAHFKLALGEKLLQWGMIKKPKFENFPTPQN